MEQEIKFGDNDTLSAIASNMVRPPLSSPASVRRGRRDRAQTDSLGLFCLTIAQVHADYLFLMTDVDCLYTDNPRKNPDAKPVRVVDDIEAMRRSGACPSHLLSLVTPFLSRAES